MSSTISKNFKYLSEPTSSRSKAFISDRRFDRPSLNPQVELFPFESTGLTFIESVQYQILVQDHFSEKVRLKQEINVLSEAVSSLQETLEYNGHYVAFLLGQISEDEFEKISADYAVDLRQESDDVIRTKIEILMHYCSALYSPSDISNIFRIDEGKAERLMQEKAK